MCVGHLSTVDRGWTDHETTRPATDGVRLFHSGMKRKTGQPDRAGTMTSKGAMEQGSKGAIPKPSHHASPNEIDQKAWEIQNHGRHCRTQWPEND